jgi:peptide/nickel transport system permease protein
MKGAGYVGRRLAFAAVTVFLAATLNFVIFRAAPGDVASALRCLNCTEQVKEALRTEFGLDKPKIEQYGLYLRELVQGNLGRSFVTQQPVWDELKRPILNTLPMLALATVFSIVAGVAMGVIAAWRRGTLAEWGNVGASLFFYAMPTQWLGLMLVIVFAGTLPVAGISDPFLEFTDPGWWTVFVDRMKHMLLPALTLGLVLMGDYALVTRSALLQTMGEDYVLTARAKGLRTWRIVRTHALRNAWLPIVSQIALSVAYLVGGSILVEAVFSYPGIGLETYEAVFARDYPVLQGAFLILVVSVVFFNLVADLLLVRLDPRVRP